MTYMDQYVFFISFFVFAAIGTAYMSDLPAEVYWHKVLPNTPMPSALQDILHPDRIGIEVNADKLNYGQYVGNVATLIAYGQYGGNLTKTNKTKKDPKINMSLFFLEKDLQPGATKNMLIERTNVLRSTFLPRKVADAIPFSSAKLPEILRHFSIKSDTNKAAAIKTTLDLCEKPEFDGEHKFCATSLESLVESSMLALGTRNVKAISTTIFSKTKKTKKQTYKVASFGLERLPGSKFVACHSPIYPFVVYYCHSVEGTKAYKIVFTGKDGTKVEAVSVCHTKTMTWDPENIAFQVLKVKPGTLPICHILPQDNILWTPSK